MSVTATPSKRDNDYLTELHKTGPDTLGGRYLRQFWHPVIRSADLAAGRAIPLTLMSEKFTLYRGETGTFHLTEHHCPHRRTQLSVGYVEGDDIRCLYHGWKFGADGRCNERPAEGSTGGIAIKAYPTEEFQGLVYVYVGPGEAPSFPPYPAFTGEGIIETLAQTFGCSYFQSWENDWDLFHAAWTHKTGEIHGPAAGSGRHDFYDSLLRTEKYTETDYGIVRTMQVMGGMTNASIMLMPATIRLLIPTFNEMSRHGGPQFRETYLIHTPIDDHTHNAFLTQLVPLTGEAAEKYLEVYERVNEMKKVVANPSVIGDGILAGNGESLQEYIGHHELVGIEDYLAHCGQGSIVDRTKEKLGRSDFGVVYLRRLMAREFGNYESAEGSKRWTFMDVLPEGTTAAVFETVKDDGIRQEADA